jgi:hypothetical protein
MPLVDYLLFLTLFAQVALIVFVGVKLWQVRQKALRSKEVRVADIALNNAAWPDYARKAQNNYANQFELPVLFFAGGLLTLHFGLTDWIFVILAVLFVVSRCFHTAIHIGSNNVMKRAPAFGLGFLALLLFWLYLLFRVTLVAL